MTISEVIKPDPLVQQAQALTDKAKALKQQSQRQRAAERARKAQAAYAKAVQQQNQLLTTA